MGFWDEHGLGVASIIVGVVAIVVMLFNVSESALVIKMAVVSFLFIVFIALVIASWVDSKLDDIEERLQEIEE